MEIDISTAVYLGILSFLIILVAAFMFYLNMLNDVEREERMLDEEIAAIRKNFDHQGNRIWTLKK